MSGMSPTVGNRVAQGAVPGRARPVAGDENRRTIIKLEKDVIAMSRAFPYLARGRGGPQSHRIANIEPAALSIGRDGIICDCNEIAKALFGLPCHELLDRHISLLLPELADVEWVQKGRPNHRLSFLSHIGHRFDAVGSDGRVFPVKIFINDLGNDGDCTLRLVIRRIDEKPAVEPAQAQAQTGRDLSVSAGSGAPRFGSDAK